MTLPLIILKDSNRKMHFFWLSILLFSCGTHTTVTETEARAGHSVEQVRQRTPTKQMTFFLDSSTAPRTRCMEYYQNKLFWLNSFNDQIYVFNEDGKVKKKIPLYTEGPHSIGVVKGFKVINDSIIAICSDFQGLALINRKGQLIRKLEFDPGEVGFLNRPLCQSAYRNKPIFTENYILFGQTVPGYWQGYTAAKIQKTSIEKIFDTRENQLSSLDITYPKKYWDGDKKQSFYHSRTFMKNLLIYSFAYDHRISSFDFNNGVAEGRKDYFAGIDSEEIPGDAPGSDIEAYIQSALSKVEYRNILSDAGTNRLFRLGYLAEPIEEIRTTDFNQLSQNRTRPFVIVLDNKMNIVKKILLEPRTYDLDLSYVLNGSLFIARNPNFSKTGKDNELIFDEIKM